MVRPASLALAVSTLSVAALNFGIVVISRSEMPDFLGWSLCGLSAIGAAATLMIMPQVLDDGGSGGFGSTLVAFSLVDMARDEGMNGALALFLGIARLAGYVAAFLILAFLVGLRPTRT